MPDKAIEESFRIATDLLVEMRQIAYRHYKYDGWLAVSNGKTNPVAQYDIRDIRYGTKCAAYLWGDDPRLIPEMGKRIFFDQHDKDGKLTWDLTVSAALKSRTSPSISPTTSATRSRTSSSRRTGTGS